MKANNELQATPNSQEMPEQIEFTGRIYEDDDQEDIYYDEDGREHHYYNEDSYSPIQVVKVPVPTNNSSPEPVRANPYEEGKNLKNSKVITGEELLNSGITEIPKLLDPILPKVGLAALVGSSETGKSALLRQLAMTICSGEQEFLGFPLQAEHRSVIYVSTEDDATATSSLLHQQNHGRHPANAFQNLRYLFDGDHVIATLRELLEQQPADCIIVDAYSDVFIGDMNQSNQVRNYLNQYKAIANDFNCLVIFLHHNGKHADKKSPSKNNVLGSQGFEAKMRIVTELRFDPLFAGQRHLCILKGNYVTAEIKKKSYVLDYDEDMTFHNTGRRMELDDLRQAEPGEVDKWASAKEKAYDWHQKEGLSYREISKRFKDEEGLTLNKDKVGEWIKTYKHSDDDEAEEEVMG